MKEMKDDDDVGDCWFSFLCIDLKQTVDEEWWSAWITW